MTLSNFCDLVWLELWDDCPPMGDQAGYREAITTLFIEGKELPHTSQGPVEPDLSKPLPTHAVEALKDLRAQIASRQGESD